MRYEEDRGHGRRHMHHHHHNHGGRRGGRARRGEAKYLLMDALRDGPKHGYEVIKALEEKSGGQYAPSPGIVYPTLQFLAEAGLVRAEQEGDRKVFHLTETGLQDLMTRETEVAEFWAQLVPATPSPEIEFLEEELEYLARTVQSALRGNPDTALVRRIRETIESCRGEIRGLIAGSESN
ncbi:MAG: PadR family transcriptional regulator [Armatimonas sp.]